jgi:hypothetical protein
MGAIAMGHASACARGIVAHKLETDPHLVDKSVISAPKEAHLRYCASAVQHPRVPGYGTRFLPQDRGRQLIPRILKTFVPALFL